MLEYCLKDTEIIHKSSVDIAMLNEFRKKHDKHIENKISKDPIFRAAYSFLYKPCGIGTIVNIECECGENADITDYSSL